MTRQHCHSVITPVDASCEVLYQPRPVVAMLLGLGSITAVAVAMLALTALVSPAQAEATPSAERQRELTRFVRQECGFCHGLQLTGGLGSPLTAQALDGKSPEALEATILYGRTGTAMPGWTPHLDAADAHWITSELLKGFPE